MSESDQGNAMPPELQALAARFAQLGLKIPPPVFSEMGGRIDHFDADGGRLVARYPVQARYQNPLGTMQGGMIAAVIDNTLGPLSFLVAPPSVTRVLEVRYVRPVTPDLPEIIAEAYVVARDEREVQIHVDVTSPAGKLLARGKATQVILGDVQIAQLRAVAAGKEQADGDDL